MEHRYPPFEPAQVVEGRMYEGFPSRADESRMHAFHAVDWAERAGIAETIEDNRYRELARRLVFMNQPEAMSAVRRDHLQIWLENRIHGREGVEAGRSLSVALERLDNLAQEQGQGGELATIRAWLVKPTRVKDCT